MNVLSRLEEIFRDILDVEDLKLSIDMTQDTLDGWDSFATINIISSVSDEFDFVIETQDLDKFKSIKEIIKVIRSKM